MENFIKRQISETGQVEVRETAQAFNVSEKVVRQTLRRMVQAGKVERDRNGMYAFPSTSYDFTFDCKGLDEDHVFNRHIAPILCDKLSEAGYYAARYVFEEILNNAIEHSDSDKVHVRVEISDADVAVTVADFGVGIFNKIQRAFGLLEKHYAILELAKGKTSTAYGQGHSGEGIFFSSKVADTFSILSDDLLFHATSDNECPICDGIPEADRIPVGTTVLFTINAGHTIMPEDVFRRYETEDHSFSKTIVPVRLLTAREFRPGYVSRSQARRLLSRVDRFKNIVLDFTGVDRIEQPFADEIFRVFIQNHPDVTVQCVNVNSNIEGMIVWVQNSIAGS